MKKIALLLSISLIYFSCKKSNTTQTKTTSPSTTSVNSSDLSGTWININNSNDFFIMRDTTNSKYSIIAHGSFSNYYSSGNPNNPVIFPITFPITKLTTPPGFQCLIPVEMPCGAGIMYPQASMLYNNPNLIISISQYTLSCPQTQQQYSIVPAQTITFKKY